jgi:predicted RNase H-like HicB family nuclease
MKSTLTENTYTAVIEKTDKWYIAYIEEIPGVNTQGKTIEEAKQNLREAIELIILSNRELAEREFSGKNVIREKIRVTL